MKLKHSGFMRGLASMILVRNATGFGRKILKRTLYSDSSTELEKYHTYSNMLFKTLAD